MTLILAGMCLVRAAYLRGNSSPEPGGHIYGSAAVDEAIRRQQEQREMEATFLAVEAEIALAYEEALEMAKMLRAGWPHITPDGALVEAALPDWRTRTTAFIGAVLGSAQRAAFKGSAKGSDQLERLESEAEFLRELAISLSRDAIRLDEAGILSARAARRPHEAAHFLDYEHSQMPGVPAPVDLCDRLDSLMREGIELVDELSESVQPEKTDGGGWKVSGGGAPEEWWDKADDFTKRIRELLIERHPALLTNYRDGYNAHLKQEREDRTKLNPAEDKRSTPEKMLALANFERSSPRRVVEASLEGLASARHRASVPMGSN